MCSLRSSREASMMRMLLQRDPVVAISFWASTRVLAAECLLFWRPYAGGCYDLFYRSSSLVPVAVFHDVLRRHIAAGYHRAKFRLQRLISLRAVFLPSSTEAAGSTIATERPNVRCSVAIAATGVATLLFRISIE